MSRHHRSCPACFFTPAARSYHEVSWRPAADVYRTRLGWLVKLDLAGVRLEDVRLEVKGRRLIVRGVRRDCHVEEGYHYQSLEISYSEFKRQLEFPASLEQARITTEYDAGMLLVRIRTEEGAQHE
jgi:HSP20 family protein